MTKFLKLIMIALVAVSPVFFAGCEDDDDDYSYATSGDYAYFTFWVYYNYSSEAEVYGFNALDYEIPYDGQNAGDYFIEESGWDDWTIGDIRTGLTYEEAYPYLD